MELSLTIYIGCIVIAAVLREGLAIGCFMCTSHNFSDPTCHDPFHPAWGRYESSCLQGRENRVGVFPAQYCIKMKGTSVDKATELVVRRCSLMDMNNQCGVFEFEGKKYDGCVKTCMKNACNTAPSIFSAIWRTCAAGAMATAILVAVRF